MNRRLSAWLLCGTLLVWPLTARGQKTNSHIAPSTIVNTPSLRTGGPVRDLTRNQSFRFHSGAEHSGTRT